MNKTAVSPSAEPRHPIRVVAQRTGLTPATLRAWERRYSVVEPHRSEGGQRLYSDDDVERLIRLRLLSEAGRPISLVASMDDEAARRLLQEDEEGRQAAARSDTEPAPRRPETGGQAADRVVEAAFRRALALDGEGLDMTLRRAAVTLGAHPFLENVLTPLLHRVGEAWARNELRPAQEHLCTSVSESVLAWLSEPGSAPDDAPRVVVATLSGERHGLGARLVAAVAGLEGWHVTHLGVDLPADDIAEAARTLDARAVALSMVNADALLGAVGALAKLRKALPPTTAILLGGGMAAGLPAGTIPEDAHIVTGLDGLRDTLAALVQAS